MTAISQRKGFQQFGLGTLVLGSLALFGLILVVYRWINELGVTTGLSDGCGWGIWKSFDVLCGIALAATVLLVLPELSIFFVYKNSIQF